MAAEYLLFCSPQSVPVRADSVDDVPYSLAMKPKGPRPTYDKRWPKNDGELDPGSRSPSSRSADPSTPDDVALIIRVAERDETALGQLYDRLSERVHAVALYLLRDPGDAEEVVEETFWQVWKTAGSYDDDRGRVFTWVTTIARSRALDRLRARKRRREEAWETLPEPDGESDIVPDRSNPLTDTLVAERRAILIEALDVLPKEQKETLILAYFKGMSQSEIAEHTGQPLGTVKTRARLALRKLREGLAWLREDEAGS